MCGRFALTETPEEVRERFFYIDRPNFPPRYNIAPTQPIGIVARVEGARRFLLVRWGLVPGWVKDPRAFSLLINARAETAAEKPAFRAAMRHRRALVPASGFYEWRKGPDGRRQPFWIRPRAGGPIGFAALWETWASADGSEVDTAAILTTAANRTLAPIHDRMPAVIMPEHFDAWLDTVATGVAPASALLTPVPDDFFEAVPVATRVNAVVNDDAEIQTPLTEPLPVAEPPAPERSTSETEPPPPRPRKARRNGGGGGEQSLF